MGYRMIALDMDGTTLTSNRTISKKTLDVLQKLKEKGYIIIIITGRMYAAAKDMVKPLKLGTPLVVYQGAAIYDINTDEMIYHVGMDKQLCEDIYKEACEKSLFIQCFANDKYYVTESNDHTEYYKTFGNADEIVIDSMHSFIENNDITKMIINDEDKRIAQNYDYFEKKFSNRAQVVTSNSHFIEFTDKSVSKGAALEAMAKKYSVERSQIIAFGDQLNDLSMIEYAGLGVAMENAVERLKKAADFVTLSNDEDGVAFALEKYCLS